MNNENTEKPIREQVVVENSEDQLLLSVLFEQEGDHSKVLREIALKLNECNMTELMAFKEALDA